MKDYYRMTFKASNENGMREAEFEMRRTWLERLLRRPARVHTFVQRKPGSTVWFRKESGRQAGTEWDMACLEASEWAMRSV
jgi:hypothetical protein